MYLALVIFLVISVVGAVATGLMTRKTFKDGESGFALIFAGCSASFVAVYAILLESIWLFLPILT